MRIRITAQSGHAKELHAQLELSFVLEQVAKDNEECLFYFSFFDSYSKMCLRLLKRVQFDYPHVKLVFIAPYAGFSVKGQAAAFDEVVVPTVCIQANRNQCINVRNRWVAMNTDCTLQSLIERYKEK